MINLKNTFALLLSLLVFTAVTFAQPGTPASTNVSGAEYPRILPDNSVMFRIKAPDAQKLQIDLGKTYDMERNDEGVWTVKTDSLRSGFHYYSLLIDGVPVADPASKSFYGMGRWASGIEIPYDVDHYAIQDVPHGDVRMQRYRSETTDSWRRFFIYTPPGYDKNRNRQYPVLYILHGGGEDETGWYRQGRTDIIMDNLLAKGEANPMLVVMMDGNMPADGMNSSMEIFKDELINDIIPFVEQNYRAQADAENRALAGLSMGGLQTLYAGVPNSDLFGYLGVFSSGWLPMQEETAEKQYAYLEEHTETFNENMNLFFLTMGGEEDIAYENNQRMMNRFDKIGIDYQYYEYPGGHTWPVWRDNLRKMAPKLFK